jgi:hypothetical protein
MPISAAISRSCLPAAAKSTTRARSTWRAGSDRPRAHCSQPQAFPSVGSKAGGRILGISSGSQAVAARPLRRWVARGQRFSEYRGRASNRFPVQQAVSAPPVDLPPLGVRESRNFQAAAVASRKWIACSWLRTPSLRRRGWETSETTPKSARLEDRRRPAARACTQLRRRP